MISAPSGDGRSPSGAVPERRASSADLPGPVAIDPYWQEDQDEVGVYADVRVPETKIDFRMRRIDAGTFLMGSPDDDPEAIDREKPQHEVTLTKGFWLGDTLCTQAVFEAITGENPSRFKGIDRPVEKVSWDDAQAFLQTLNERLPGNRFVLPTEAQWEYACRAGSTAPRYGEFDAIAWHSRNSSKQTQSVRQKRPNIWGLYDMLGNVWEWCQDHARGWNEQQPYATATRMDPVARQEEHSYRVVRGGAWRDLAQDARAASRLAFSREARRVSVGFRLARGQAVES